MHLRHLLVRDCKLMHQLEVAFVHDDGSPRLWTVFVGENGTCKTTLLRTIAIAATGGAFANHLVNDPKAYLDRRGDQSRSTIEAAFGFSRDLHELRMYPYHSEGSLEVPPEVVSSATISAIDVEGRTWYGSWETRQAHLETIRVVEETLADMIKRSAVKGAAAAMSGLSESDRSFLLSKVNVDRMTESLRARALARLDPLDEARRNQLRHWFIAGYGTGRVLAVPTSAHEGGVPGRDRVKSLFDTQFLPEGTRFSDRLARSFGEQYARDFTRCLRTALIERMHTARLRDLELRAHGSSEEHLESIESHHVSMALGDGEVTLPTVWLSQGYQAVISLVADIIGHVWLEAGEPVELDDMEGIVLVDELDLHLHPTWQTEIVTALKATFPRVQFIVTTHSPLVLAGCRAEEVWTLAQDEATGDITARQGHVPPMLLTASEMYREYFGVSRTYASELGEALRQYIELASNPFRSDADDATIAALRKHLLDNRVDVDYQPVARKSAS